MTTNTTTARPTSPARPAAPPRWAETPACAEVDPELFFPLEEDGPGAGPARGVCAGCPLRDRCLEYALAAGMAAGIWGGLTTTERTAVLRAAGGQLRW